MIFLLLSCKRIDFNIKSKSEAERQEMSLAIDQEIEPLLRYFHEINKTKYRQNQEDEQGLIPVEEAIRKEKIRAITILSEDVCFDYIRKVAKTGIEKNSIDIYQIFKQTNRTLLSFCLKVAKEENNSAAISKILETMEATELEREILLETKELNIEGELKEGNESIIAVSKAEIFNMLKERANSKLFLECLKFGYEDRALEIIEKVNITENADKGYTPLMLAIINKCERVVGVLLEKRVVLDDKNYMGNTALMYAIQNKCERIVSLLLAAGAKVNERNLNGFTPLIQAIIEGNDNIVSLLLKAGANINQEKDNSLRLLVLAIINSHPEVMKWLIERKNKENKEDDNGFTPFIYSMLYGNKKIVSLLLKAGANPNMRIESANKQGMVPIMLASSKGYVEVVRLLLQSGAKVNSIIKTGFEKGKSALMYASEAGHAEVVDILLKAKAKIDASILYGMEKSKTSFILAIENGHTRVVGLLLRAGVNPNFMLKASADKGKTPLMIASRTGNKRIVRLLLRAGAEVNTIAAEGTHEEGVTALMLASKSGDKETVSLLLEAGALVNNQDIVSQNALMQAVSSSNKEVVSLLLEAGAEINMKDFRGANCLFWVSSEDSEEAFELIKFLLSKGANPKAVIGLNNIFYQLNGISYNFLAALNIKSVFKLLDLGLVNIHDLDDNQMTNFYSILKNLEKEKNLARYKMLLVTLLTRYNAHRLF